MRIHADYQFHAIGPARRFCSVQNYYRTNTPVKTSLNYFFFNIYYNNLQFSIDDTTLFRMGLRLCRCIVIGQRDLTKPRLCPYLAGPLNSM